MQSNNVYGRFMQSLVDTLSACVVVLDARGRIVLANRAWRAFAAQNAGNPPLIVDAVDHLAACERAGREGMELARGMSDVIERRRDEFSMEYAWSSGSQQRRFLARVSRVAIGPADCVMVAHDDITVLHQARLKTGTASRTYLDLFEPVPLGVVYHDTDGRALQVNPAAEQLLGLPEGQIRGRALFQLFAEVSDENGQPLPPQAWPTALALQTGRPVRGVVLQVLRGDGRRLWLQVGATPIFRDGRLHEVYTLLEDVSQRVRLNRQLRLQTGTDPLTGVATRQVLRDRISLEHARVQRHSMVVCSLMLVDIDDFRQFNERFGQAAGDAMLVNLAREMRVDTRTVDVVARTGGEEFAVLLPDTGLDDSVRLADRLRERLAASSMEFGGRRVSVTVSVGVSVMDPLDASPDDLWLRAESAAAKAGQLGRNTVCFEAAE